MEGIHTLRDLVIPEDWLAKVYLKDAYFPIPIHKSHQGGSCTWENTTSVFSAHSLRVASPSAAANLGITTNDILKAVDWSSEYIF